MKTMLSLLVFGLPFFLHASDCAPVASGLVGWWRAEGNGNDSYGTNNGSLRNGVSFDTGEVGEAFHFVSGSNPIVYIPDNPALALTNSLTIEGWVKANFGYHILSRGDDQPAQDPYVFGFADVTGLQLRLIIYDASGQYMILKAPGPIATNVWTHVAATLDGDSGDAFIYVNGQVVAHTNTTLHPAGPLTGPEPSVCIGNAPGLGGFPIDGWIDELGLYSRALSQTEVQSIYLAGARESALPRRLRSWRSRKPKSATGAAA